MTVTWRSVPTTLRTLARWVTIVQLVGYTTSLIFVWHTTRLVPPGVAARYRGVDPEATQAAMQFPKSFAEMLTITHTHLLSMAVIFVLTGLGVALCERVSERWKRWLIAEPFVALLVSFSAMWLMRYVDPRFSWLLEASSALLAVTFYVQSYVILRELRQVERPLALFDTASDLCELYRRAGRKRMRVDRDLRAVLAQAAAFKRATGGTFNVAVEPLMLVWGFHRHRASAPTAAELVEAREAVLAAVVELDRDVGRLPSAHTQSAFGAIGVGHGIALRQASVVTRTAVAADALSTAMLVSGRRPEGVLLAYRV